MLELLDVLLLLLAAGLVLIALLRPKASPQAARLDAALAEIRRREGRFPSLSTTLKQVKEYGRDLSKLPPLIAETGRFLAKPGLDAPTRARLEARRDALARNLERGIAFLERLGAEMMLGEPREPPSLIEFPGLRLELREVLHPA